MTQTMSGARHAAVRAITGTTGTWQDDFITLAKSGVLPEQQPEQEEENLYPNGYCYRRWVSVDESYIPDV